MDGKPITEINSTDANARFGELIQRAQHGGETFIVTRHGNPAAAIVPIGTGADTGKPCAEPDAAERVT